MIQELFDAAKAKVEQLRVEYRQVNGFEMTELGTQYSKHYPSVGYDLTIEEMNAEEYLYSHVYRGAATSDWPEGPVFFNGPVIQSGVGDEVTNTWYAAGGVVDYVKTGFSDWYIYKHPTPYLVRLQLLAITKQAQHSRILEDNILEVFGDRSYITCTWSILNGFSESYDMELQNIINESELYRRIQNQQKLHAIRYTYQIEACKYFATTYAVEGVVSRFYTEGQVAYYQTTTGMFSETGLGTREISAD